MDQKNPAPGNDPGLPDATASEKRRENRARRIAHRRRLRLAKSRSRAPLAPDFGLFALIDVRTGGTVNEWLANRWTCSWTLEQVEAFLNAGGHAA